MIEDDDDDDDNNIGFRVWLQGYQLKYKTHKSIEIHQINKNNNVGLTFKMPCKWNPEIEGQDKSSL